MADYKADIKDIPAGNSFMTPVQLGIHVDDVLSKLNDAETCHVERAYHAAKAAGKSHCLFIHTKDGELKGTKELTIAHARDLIGSVLSQLVDELNQEALFTQLLKGDDVPLCLIKQNGSDVLVLCMNVELTFCD
jgi:hypothetical protein